MWGGIEGLWSSDRGEVYDSFLHQKVGRSTKIVIVLNQHKIQGGSNMTGTDLCVNKPYCAAAVRP